ncbi:choice-of-anchor Q domain-containing protein [uncultured Kriegella sp.]|uniref:choice-of-anchor Q domain-containing protein n=1 Tax=uncultured Kriegella sp. TaxID=1798910 RepID=UPI0030DC8355|tara:strand:- start:235928 stop:238948 length:3021 start_codon:yes stop_codon:yes gene_type:complete
MTYNKYVLTLLILSVSFFQSLTAQSKTYYITTSGKSSNSGLSEASAWNWDAAVDRVQAGDVVYVKSGSYNVSGLWFKQSGTSSKPIVFRGYTSSPGDISSKAYGTMDYGNSINSIGFPVIKPTNSSDSYAIFVGGNYIELHNIGFNDPYGRAGYAVLVQGNNNKLDNLAFSDLSLDTKGYQGSSVYIRGNNNTVSNCYGENSAYAFIFIDPHTSSKGNNNTIKYNEYRNDDTSRQTDYYLTTRYKGNDSNTAANNSFENNRIYRLHSGSHNGHGLSNGGGRNNTWKDNLIYRTIIEVRYPSSSGAVFEGNSMTGSDDNQVTIENGATNITLKNNYLECDHAALLFIVKGYNPMVSSASPNNIKVFNNVFKGGRRIVSFGEGSYETTTSKNIDIYNNVFDGQSGGIRYYNSGTSMNFKNNIVINSTSKKWATISSGSISVDGDNNIFHNNSFTTPTTGFSSTKNTNPLFTNSGTQSAKYKLKATSPAINAGVAYSARSTDLNGNSLVSTPDIGPHEYQGSQNSNNNSNGSCTVIPEYSLNGVWQNGQTNLNVAEGTNVILSMIPNGIGLSIKLPNGKTAGDNFKLGEVTTADSGAYVLTSATGCQTTLNLTVGDPGSSAKDDCPSGDITPEYRLNGSWASGQKSLTVAEGTDIVLSMLPNGKNLTITLPNGSTAGDNYRLGKVTEADAGSYIITSEDGCQTTLNLTVGNSTGGNDNSNSGNDCPSGNITPEYSLNGSWQSGQNNLSLAEGTSVILSMIPNGVGLTIKLPNGSTVGDNYRLGKVTSANSGAYILTSANGCQTTLNLSVGGSSSGSNSNNNSCSTGITSEYRVNGVWGSGSSSITAVEGKDVTFSMLPNGIGLTVKRPNGSTVGDNYRIQNLTSSDSGTYVLTSANGCQTSVYLTVSPKSSSFKARIGEGISTEPELESSKISVYPNPVQRSMNVTLPANASYTQFALYTLSGVMIKQGAIDSVGNSFAVDVSSAPKGLLLLNVMDEEGNTEFIKVLKE